MRRAAIVCAIVVVGISAFMAYRYAAQREEDRQSRLFYGIVIDQDGKPLQGVEVQVFLTGFTQNPVMMGIAPDSDNQTRFSVFTGPDGTFQVKVPQRYEQLSIEAVILQGYDWVFDWIWNGGGERFGAGDNRHYKFSGKYVRAGEYVPDPARPAIFPLHAKGNPSPATLPSRGGSDKRRDSLKWITNEPTPLAIPSAGPGAPQGHDEINRRISQYFNQMNAAATRPNR